MFSIIISFANLLDKRGYYSQADAIDALIKKSFITNVNDLAQAIEFYNNINMNEITPDNLIFNGITIMTPENFLPGIDTAEKGWLKNYPINDWAKLLNEKYKRNFTYIVNMYVARKMNPAIQINDEFADGMARAIFFNAIDEDMPVAQFTSNI